jgi:hypothetical protein
MATATIAAYVKDRFSEREASFLDQLGELLKRYQAEEDGIPFTIVLSRPGVNLQVGGNRPAMETASPQESAQPRNYCWNGFVFIVC